MSSFFQKSGSTSTVENSIQTDVDAAAASAAAAAASETAAASSAADAATAAASVDSVAADAAAASSNASAALTYKNAAEDAQAAAEAAQAAAETAETNASTSASTSSTKASEASTSASNASTSETNSASSATASAASATSSAASASAAATSEANASTSETNAASSASSASTSASTATTQAGISTTKAGEASTSASNAATSEANAATSESNAASSATAAAASQTAAAASAASAASAFDSFDDRYLGTFTTAAEPTIDNDGDALVTGALYFNSTEGEMRVYDGSAWIAASAATEASLLMYEYTATSGQTTFSGADDNANTLSYTIDNIIVTLNGVVLDPADYTATSGTSIVLGTGAALNDELNVLAFKSFTTADMVSATNGGTFGNDITIDGKLLVGKTTSNSDTAGSELKSNGSAFHTRDGSSPIFLNRLTSDGSIAVFRKDGSTVGSIGVNTDRIYLVNANEGIAIDDSLNEIFPCSSTGGTLDATIGLGNSGRRFKDLYLSGGVYLGGTGAANYLDDYEEGTWTVDLQDSSGNSATNINGNGRYIKVGNLVTVWGRFNDPDLTGLTPGDDVRIYGLPFTSSIFTGTGMQFNGSVRMENVTFASSPDGYVNTDINEGATFLRLVETRNNAVDDFITVNQMSATSEMRFTATYPTTAF